MQLRLISVFALWFLPLQAGAFNYAPAYQQDLVRELLQLDGRSWKYCTGNKYGIANVAGRVIIPTNFSDVTYEGNGIFLATETEPGHRYYFGKNRHLYDRDGNELQYKIPQGCLLLNVFSFGSTADAEAQTPLLRLPEDTLLQIEKNGQRGLCDIHGCLALPPENERIYYSKPGFAVVCKNSSPGRFTEIEIKTGAISRELGQSYRSKSRVPIFTTSYSGELFPDRKLICDRSGEELFDRDYWREKRIYPIAPERMFNHFLHQYDFIGMPETTVLDLLGKPDKIKKESENSEFFYSLNNAGCLRSSHGLKVYFSQEKVQRWCFYSENNETESVSKNVVLDFPEHQNLVGKIWPEDVIKLKPKL
ncbi:MAG: hypothetical protein JST01_14675 [Cyanobacteria bacterium SZAS TMP-1]|nr:hypothetical protein [Cyanobacteria bacterium SZAS TMP-1]